MRQTPEITCGHVNKTTLLNTDKKKDFLFSWLTTFINIWVTDISNIIPVNKNCLCVLYNLYIIYAVINSTEVYNKYDFNFYYYIILFYIYMR